jgi:hypothetical protein
VELLVLVALAILEIQFVLLPIHPPVHVVQTVVVVKMVLVRDVTQHMISMVASQAIKAFVLVPMFITVDAQIQIHNMAVVQTLVQ